MQGNGVADTGPFALRRDNAHIACFDEMLPEGQKPFGMDTVIVSQKD
jgi:hypothetical protein